MGDDLFIVEDAELDQRFSDNPLFLSEPHVRFYAGAPLIAPNGHRIGTLCVIDPQAKKLDEKQKLTLKSLSKHLITIFESKKIINKQRENEFLLKETQKNAKIGGWELDVETLTTKWTEETYRIHQVDLGTPTNTEDGINFYAPHERARIAQYVNDCINKGIRFESSFEFITAKNNKRWVHCLGTPVKGKDGQVLKIIGTFQDVTTQKQLEEQLRSSNQYLDLALEGAGLGIWDWDLRDNSVKFDKRWAEMLGLNLDDIPMELSTWESRVHPDDIEKCHADIKSYMDGKIPYYENVHRMKHQNGHWIYILDRGRFSDWDKEGKPIRFTGTHFDVTRSKEKEIELSLVLKSNKIGIWKYDLLKKTLLWDNSMHELYQIKKEEFDGDFDTWLKSLHPDFLEKVEKDFKEALAGKKTFDTTYAILTPNNTTKYMKARAIVEREKDGQATMITGVSTDITEEYTAMLELNKQTKIAQHQAKLASIGELAAGVGHEINNPLAIVKGYLSTISRKIAEGKFSQQDIQPYLEKMNVATNRIERIINGLRTFSRSNSSEIIDFPPVEAIEESFNMVNEIYSRDGININLNDKTTRALFIKGNRGKFQQMLMNLISNAKDATLGQSLRQIDIAVYNQQESFIIDVKDNGCGIPNSIKEKIFDPFFTTKEVNKGTGIGLSLVHNFIKELNGTIDFSSKDNEGSLFTVQLPAFFVTQEIEQKKDVPQKQEEYQGNVILADDEEGIRDLLKEMLENMGLIVTTAKDGKQALDLYLKSPENFDLIISDMKMPEMDGPMLLKNLREIKDLKQPKFIFITGGININFDDKKIQLNELINGYILKPFNEQKIHETLSKCLKPKRVYRLENNKPKY